ncbi:MAG: hypothetical protein DMF62_11045 [Acidobacteria bacterium]|nr:MAG: hypothetical protein DMF62_11045 [Acidobacteriota bacterium]PYS99939.1 MAG: hypothetical protein DMF63_09375 [Acidobacteriota bacterium]
MKHLTAVLLAVLWCHTLKAGAEPEAVRVVVSTNIALTVGLTNTPLSTVTIFAPTNVTVNVVRLNPPSTNEPPYGQIPPFTVMTNLCDVPITYVASNSTNDPGGLVVRTYRNHVFRRQLAAKTAKPQSP